ncbi:DUF1707 domain-containing protein [Streptosporangium sp. NPDC087985]|uniref:DUF1707 SHOCT-like domain-containing protein n=1 Tax=Streptosporangium sp. NPDC087985 TaxID=3366196 RepID=UPI00381EBACA
MSQKKPYQGLWLGTGDYSHAAPPLRIGDAERDEVTAALREHYAQGRLTPEELDGRLEAALAARTADDLERVIGDLPRDGRRAGDSSWPGTADRRRRPPRGRHEVLTPMAIFALATIALVTSRAGSLFPISKVGLSVLLVGGAVSAIVLYRRYRNLR